MPGKKMFMKKHLDKSSMPAIEERLRELALHEQPLRPLRELLGLVPLSPPSSLKPLIYEVVDSSVKSGPTRRNRKRRRRHKQKSMDKNMDIIGNRDGDKYQSQSSRFTPNMPGTTTNIPRQTSPSSSTTFSFPSLDAVPPAPSMQSEESEDIIPPTEACATVHLIPPRDDHSPVQSTCISSCSEVEVFQQQQQQPPRKRTRKRRRITTKLSLSQNSHRQKQSRQEQSLQTSDGFQILAPALHVSSSASSTSTTSSINTSISSSNTSTSSTRTSTESLNTNRSPALSTSSNISRHENSHETPNLRGPIVAQAVHQPAIASSSSSGSTNSFYTSTNTIRYPDRSTKQEASHETLNRPAPSVLRGVHHHDKANKQCESIPSVDHRQARQQGSSSATQQCIKAGSVQSIHGAATHKQHIRNKTTASQGRRVTFQSPMRPDSHTEPKALNTKWQADITLTSTSDSDESVYYEAASRLSIFEESCAGPSDVQYDFQPYTGQQGDGDTSSSYYSQRESESTSFSHSSSGSSTFLGESLLNKTVITNKHAVGTFKRPAQEPYKDRCHPAKLKQMKRHKTTQSNHDDKQQINPQPETSRRDPGGWSRERRHHKEASYPDQSIGSPWQEVEVSSSSTSEPQSEGEMSCEKVHTANISLPRKTEPSLEGSVVSSCSSSSSSSVLLTQEGMGCIQSIGKVFQKYFGGSVEDNLSLIQRNNYNLLQSLIELQAAPHHPTPPPPPPPRQHKPPDSEAAAVDADEAAEAKRL